MGTRISSYFGKKMKLLISACVLGEDVRWNGSNKLKKYVMDWAEKNSIELIPVCPENLAFGTPRPPIRLVQIEEKVIAEQSKRMLRKI